MASQVSHSADDQPSFPRSVILVLKGVRIPIVVAVVLKVIAIIQQPCSLYQAGGITLVAVYLVVLGMSILYGAFRQSHPSHNGTV